MNFKQILADNIVSVIIFIFTLGTLSTTISLLSIDVAELQEKVVELESHKASKSALNTLDNRVRRKLDGTLKSNSNKITELKIEYKVLQNDMGQVKGELKTVWKNYNRLNCK